MWGILGGSKEKEATPAAADGPAPPPPMLFDPAAVGRPAARSSGRNPLTRQKRPGVAARGAGGVNPAAQPQQGGGEPLSPTSPPANTTTFPPQSYPPDGPPSAATPLSPPAAGHQGTEYQNHNQQYQAPPDQAPAPHQAQAQGYPAQPPAQGYPAQPPAQGYPAQAPAQGYPAPPQNQHTQDPVQSHGYQQGYQQQPETQPTSPTYAQNAGSQQEYPQQQENFGTQQVHQQQYAEQQQREQYGTQPVDQYHSQQQEQYGTQPVDQYHSQQQEQYGTQPVDQYHSQQQEQYGSQPAQEQQSAQQAQYNSTHQAQEQVHEQVQQVHQVQQEPVVYRSEEEYNAAYYGCYGCNPPPGEWQTYQAQWAAYLQQQQQQQQQQHSSSTSRSREASSSSSRRSRTESDRTATDSARYGSDSDRTRTESGHYPSGTDRTRTDSGRYGSESERIRTESSRYGSESERTRTESGRYGSESERIRTESGRYGSESDRCRTQSGRYGSESERSRTRTQSGHNDARPRLDTGPSEQGQRFRTESGGMSGRHRNESTTSWGDGRHRTNSSTSGPSRERLHSQQSFPDEPTWNPDSATTGDSASTLEPPVNEFQVARDNKTPLWEKENLDLSTPPNTGVPLQPPLSFGVEEQPVKFRLGSASEDSWEPLEAPSASEVAPPPSQFAQPPSAGILDLAPPPPATFNPPPPSEPAPSQETMRSPVSPSRQPFGMKPAGMMMMPPPVKQTGQPAKPPPQPPAQPTVVTSPTMTEPPAMFKSPPLSQPAQPAMSQPAMMVQSPTGPQPPNPFPSMAQPPVAQPPPMAQPSMSQPPPMAQPPPMTQPPTMAKPPTMAQPPAMIHPPTQPPTKQFPNEPPRPPFQSPSGSQDYTEMKISRPVPPPPQPFVNPNYIPTTTITKPPRPPGITPGVAGEAPTSRSSPYEQINLRGSRGSAPNSRPASRSSSDTIARLKREREEKRRGGPSPDSPFLGQPLHNSTSRRFDSSFSASRNISASVASLLAEQEAYENVTLKGGGGGGEGDLYENHELLNRSSNPASTAAVAAPAGAPKLPPRTGANNTSSSSTHRRNHSAGSGSSLKSGRSEKYRAYASSRTATDDRQPYRRGGEDPRYPDPRYQDPRYHGSARYGGYRPEELRYREQMLEIERYRRELIRREEMLRKEELFRFQDPRMYHGGPDRYVFPYNRSYDRMSHYRDQSDEVSVSHVSESLRSDTQTTDMHKTDTDMLISDSEPASLDVSQDISEAGSQEDDVGEGESKEEGAEEEEEEEVAVVEEEPALADMYTEPYLYIEPHLRASCFAPNRFLRVLPGEEMPHVVEISEFKLLYWQEQKAMDDFPGPLIKGETPKRDVMKYCKKRAAALRKDGCTDEGQVLVWELLALFCKQNGVVVGTDVTEMLLHEQDTTTMYSKTSLTSSAEVTDEDRVEAMAKIRECLFEGQRRDALEVCVHYQLWDVAMVISTTLSQDLLQDTMQRFSASLHRDDPLRSFGELVSHAELPSCCNHTDNWRQHLAMLLSNQSDEYDPNYNHIMSYANTLASEGQVYASHFACLLSGSKLTSVNDKTSPIALIGLDHTKEVTGVPYVPIQLTELYEYCRALGGEQCLVPFQGTKFLYARELAKVGHVNRALSYLQQISRCINTSPTSYRARFIRRVHDECMRMLVCTGKWPIVPKWLDSLKETLTERKLEISNRSTAYSSRVATPEIQRLAQYMLHRQNSTKQVEQVSAEEKTSAALSPHHDNLLASGFTWDGQYYRHDHYQGWVYVEGNWVADPALAQVQPAATQESGYQSGVSGYPGNQNSYQGNQEHQTEVDGYTPAVTADGAGYTAAAADYSQYNGYASMGDTSAAATGYTQPSEGIPQQENTDFTQHDATGYTQPEGGYTSQSGTDYSTGYTHSEAANYGQTYSQSETAGYSQSETAGYSQSEIAGYSQSETAGYTQVPESTTGYIQPEVPAYSLPETTTTYPGEEEITPRGEQLGEGEGTTDDPPADGEAEEEAAPPPSFSFFNPAQFSGSTMLAPIVADLPPVPSSISPPGDEEIKTPTNDGPADTGDDLMDDLYNNRKKKPVEDTRDDDKPKKEDSKKDESGGGGIFSRLFKRDAGAKSMILPDDSKPLIYWDEKLGQYVDTTKGSDDEDEDAPPPPTSSLPVSSRSSVCGGDDKTSSAPTSPGRTRRKPAGRGRLANRYVDVLGGSGMHKSATSPDFR